MPKRKLASIPELTETSREVIFGLQKETDRGLALIAAAFLDDALGAMLEKHFAHEPKVITSELLTGDGPLGTFSARTKLAYCLGWFGPTEFRDLNLICDIRNDFAHVHKPLTFAEQSVQDRCRELTACNILPKNLGPLTARNRFMLSAVFLIQRLLVFADGQDKTKPGEDKKLGERVRCEVHIPPYIRLS
jgi:DNA-binding MltR family transcriptional regulator